MNLLFAPIPRYTTGMTHMFVPHAQRLARLREWLTRENLAGFILPVTDEFQGEYSAEYARRATWLTGFDGSAGVVVILRAHAFLLVDGRYTLQASQEVDTQFYTIRNSGECSIADCLREANVEGTVAYDPWLMTYQQFERLQKSISDVDWQALATNPIDLLWEDQPARPNCPIMPHPTHYAGRPSDEKLAEVTLLLQSKEVDAVVLTMTDSICWLLNIRGQDVPYNPLALIYAVITAAGKCILFLNEGHETDALKDHIGAHISIWPMQEIGRWFSENATEKIIGLDSVTAPIWFYKVIASAKGKIVWMQDPVVKSKAIKNQTEIAGMRHAHAIDGAAVTRLLFWLENNGINTLTELNIVKRLEEFRSMHPDYRGGSFATIAGSGPHGAIVHYRASEQSNRALQSNDILLLDSGGQYPFGTTDITRTVGFGNISDEFQHRFTLVLKGHIALAKAVFPEGTSGSQLDVMARIPLWQEGLDYDHGTGHGVGAYLCVHEGPQRISKKASDVALLPGMILSNEPGYYKTGEYGIRIENLVLVVEKDQHESRRFFGFETLTLCPIDTRLVNLSLLALDERAWLNDYHARVWEVISPQLSEKESAWLYQRTRPL